MARLSKHGKELLRISQEKEITDPQDSAMWRCWTRAYMADGTVLQKYDVRFKSILHQKTGELHSFGWKIHAKVKADRTPEQAVATIRQAIAEGRSKWQIVSGGNPPVIISQARIMAACESGDSIGFCQECGAEADGVEPDARNYKCESCGAFAVYGAEELLMSSI